MSTYSHSSTFKINEKHSSSYSRLELIKTSQSICGKFNDFSCRDDCRLRVTETEFTIRAEVQMPDEYGVSWYTC